MATREANSFCRICLGHCGVVLTLDERDRLVSVRGDHEDTKASTSAADHAEYPNSRRMSS